MDDGSVEEFLSIQKITGLGIHGKVTTTSQRVKIFALGYMSAVGFHQD